MEVRVLRTKMPLLKRRSLGLLKKMWSLSIEESHQGPKNPQVFSGRDLGVLCGSPGEFAHNGQGGNLLNSLKDAAASCALGGRKKLEVEAETAAEAARVLKQDDAAAVC